MIHGTYFLRTPLTTLPLFFFDCILKSDLFFISFHSISHIYYYVLISSSSLIRLVKLLTRIKNFGDMALGTKKRRKIKIMNLKQKKTLLILTLMLLKKKRTTHWLLLQKQRKRKVQDMSIQD